MQRNILRSFPSSAAQIPVKSCLCKGAVPYGAGHSGTAATAFHTGCEEKNRRSFEGTSGFEIWWPGTRDRRCCVGEMHRGPTVVCWERTGKMGGGGVVFSGADFFQAEGANSSQLQPRFSAEL